MNPKTTCLSEPMPTFRLRSFRGRLLCLLSFPRLHATDGYVREILVIASPTPPRLRRLTVYRRLAGPPPRPRIPRAA
jgi:hypothetical protein